MGTLGRYTTYVGATGLASTLAQRKLLSELYPNSPMALAGALANADETKAQAAVLAVATADPGTLDAPSWDPTASKGGGIQPKGGIQAGDSGMGLGSVDLSFGGAPDITKVAWAVPGDPANGYIPDVQSPTAGPGHTQGTDKTGAPTGDQITEIKALATTEDPAGQGTVNPAPVGNAIYKYNKLGSGQSKGQSTDPKTP